LGRRSWVRDKRSLPSAKASTFNRSKYQSHRAKIHSFFFLEFLSEYQA
jgi:hypothetical protein